MKEYIQKLHSHSGKIGEFKSRFNEEMVNKYPMLRGHGESGVTQHFDYMYRLATGKENEANSKNQCYINIFLSNQDWDNGQKWTDGENAVCFYELKEYLSGVELEENSFKETYAKRLLEGYELFAGKSSGELIEHLNYLSEIAFGKRDVVESKGDSVYYRILVKEEGESQERDVEARRLDVVGERTVGNQFGETMVKANEQQKDQAEETLVLTEEQQASLLSFVGYGDIGNLDIAFFMNEGGFGNGSLADNMELLCNRYKQDSNNRMDQDWREGYWHKDRWQPGTIRKIPDSPFLKLSSRMVLALEDKDSSVEKWFQTGDEQIKQTVKKFIMEYGLYSDRPGIKSALFDWRPLPRRRESDSLPYDNVDAKQYFNAFSFKPTSPFYTEWVDKRMNVFKNLLTKQEIPFLLSFGDVQVKLQLFKGIWGDIEFEPITLPVSKKVIYVSSKIGKNTTIIATEFLDYTHLGYKGACELTEFIREKKFSPSAPRTQK